MTRDERSLFILSAELEFENLCHKVVSDGRGPGLVAFSMTQKLSDKLRYYQKLWDSCHKATPVNGSQNDSMRQLPEN